MGRMFRMLTATFLLLFSTYLFLLGMICIGKYKLLSQEPVKGDYLFPTFLLEMPDKTKLRAVYRKSLVRPKNAPLLLFFRGTHSNLQLYALELDIFEAESGFDLLTYEYRSTGLNEDLLLSDADHLYQHATKTLGYQPDQIVVYGYSLGSVSATWLAAKYPVAMCIVHQGFAHFAFELEPLARFWFPNTKLSPLKNLLLNPSNQGNKEKTPLMVFHGTKDSLTPAHQAYSLIETARKQDRPYALVWLKTGHLTLFEDDKVLQFLIFLSGHLSHGSI